jgi:hypothetical protein
MRFPNPFRANETPRPPQRPADGGRLQQLERELAQVEVAFRGVCGRHDDAAARLQSNALADELVGLRAARAKELQLQNEAHERHALITELVDIYEPLTSQLSDGIEALITHGGVPVADDISHVFVLAQRVEMLRVAIFGATQQQRFARRIDALDRIRFGWHQQHIARVRALDRVRTRSLRPHVSPQPWEPRVARLHELTKQSKEFYL